MILYRGLVGRQRGLFIFLGEMGFLGVEDGGSAVMGDLP